jgi:hypothetical protein
MKLTTHVYLALRLRMFGTIPSLSQHTFTECVGTNLLFCLTMLLILQIMRHWMISQ